MPYLKNLGHQINRRLLEVERVSRNCGLSAESIQRVVQPTVTQDSQRAPGLKFGDPWYHEIFRKYAEGVTGLKPRVKRSGTLGTEYECRPL